MIIKSVTKEYSVVFEENLEFIKQLIKEENAEFVIDRQVYHLYQKYFAKIPEERLFLLDAEEENKTMQSVLDICEKMTDISAKKNAVLVSIGGGIVQDITGFTANILYRGIKWIFVPTTLLAQCDSCIGGKTSLNYLKYKNLLGTFYPPVEIHICTDFAKTLSEHDYESGLGEVIKFNIMRGRKGIKSLQERFDDLLQRDSETVNYFVHNSLEFKKDFIEQDEFDRGERIKLNFAHTFGHAIEAISEYRVPHGTAVAIGMIMANYISVKRGILSNETAETGKQLLLAVIHIDKEILDVPLDQFLGAIKKDKKQVDGTLTAVLMTNVPRELQIVHDLKVYEVEDAINYFKSSYES